MKKSGFEVWKKSTTLWVTQPLSHSLFHTTDNLFGVPHTSFHVMQVMQPLLNQQSVSSGHANSLKRCNDTSRHHHKWHWVIGPGLEKKLNERCPELCPLVDQNPKLWRGRARSWSCRRCPCSHPCTCPRQVLPSFGSTSWVKQGQELCLRSRLNALSKRIGVGIPMLSSIVFIKAHWDWCREPQSQPT